MRRPLLVVLLVVALSVLVGGCVRVPTSGRVERVEGPQQSCQNCVDVEVLPPLPGDDPRAIVDGFLRANANYQPNYDIARRYLTRDAVQSWRPQEGVTVYDAEATAVDGARVTLTGRVVGVLGADRAFTAKDAPLAQQFTLVKQDGEWRIDKPPPGLLVAKYAFTRFYSSHDLYFLGNAGIAHQPAAAPTPSLVPDPVYLPNLRGPDQIASALVNQLLVGPSTWLAKSVTTAIPTDTRLSVDSVTVADGVASVPLSDTVLALPDAQRSLLAAQIVYTLKEAVAIRGVAITVNQQGFRVPESDPTTLVVPTTAFSSRLDPVGPTSADQLYAVRGGKVSRVDATTGELRRLDADLGPDPVSSLAVSVTDTDLAAVTAGGTRLVQTSTAAGAKASTALSGVTGLGRPQFTRFDELWALGRKGGKQQLWCVVGDKAAVVSVASTPRSEIAAFKISPDGVRIALLQRSASGAQILLGRISRGDRVSVEGLRRLSTAPTTATQLRKLEDVSWLDATHLLVLGAPTDKEAAEPYSVSEDGSSVIDQGGVVSWNPVEVAVLLRTQSAVVRSGDGHTWRDQGTTWVPFVDDVQALAYPG